jgi:RsiW-degrading membrane proteinase PrsW (M82 family)
MYGEEDYEDYYDEYDEYNEYDGEAEEEQPMSVSEYLDKLCAKFDGNRIEGAHLPRDSWVHWLYALGSIALFLLMLRYFFDRGNAEWTHLVLVGVCIATFGILFLLFVQFIAAVTQGWILVSRNIVIMIVYYILYFIGFSYNAALDPANGFWLSFFGFTFGVGFCEELSKALPLFFRMRNDGELNWRGACMWGMAGGVGFGVAEGIMYSSDFYNGVATFGIYPVRFVSCVALHAVWSGAVGVTAHKYQHLLQQNGDWGDMAAAFLRIMAVPMILHGLYDTLLKKEMNELALLTAVASFAWLVFVMVQAAKRDEAAEADALRRALTAKTRAMYGT